MQDMAIQRMVEKSLCYILHEAEKKGYTRWQRHRIADAYRSGEEEYKRIVPRINLYQMDLHASIKALGYMHRHRPYDQR